MKIRCKFEETIVALVLLVMLLVSFANVICRYVLNISIAFTEELVNNLFPFATMLGASIACARGANMGLTMLTDRLPRKAQLCVMVFDTLAGVVLFGLLFYYGIIRIGSQMHFKTFTPLLRIPNWIISISVPLGSVCYIIRSVQVLIRAWKGVNE